MTWINLSDTLHDRTRPVNWIVAYKKRGKELRQSDIEACSLPMFDSVFCMLSVSPSPTARRTPLANRPRDNLPRISRGMSQLMGLRRISFNSGQVSRNRHNVRISMGRSPRSTLPREPYVCLQ
jgi:hypothetical protein